AVEGEIERVAFVERRERDAELDGELGGGLRGRDAEDAQSGGDAFGECVDERDGGAAGAEADRLAASEHGYCPLGEGAKGIRVGHRVPPGASATYPARGCCSTAGRAEPCEGPDGAARHPAPHRPRLAGLSLRIHAASDRVDLTAFVEEMFHASHSLLRSR